MAAQQAAGPTPPPQQPYPETGQQYSQPPAAAQTGGGVADNVAGALCYIPFCIGLIIAIVFLAISPYNQRRFVRFHAFQAIFLFVALLALGIVNMMVSIAAPYGVSTLLSMVLWIGGLALTILMIVKAYQNEMFELPVIGPLARKQA
jgi:uncharacterized membrane protein